jgi:hypothetical protein
MICPSVPNLRKMELKNQAGVASSRVHPPQYAKKEPSKNSYAALKECFSKLEKAVRKRKGSIVIPTLNRELGQVVWGN